MLYFISFAVLFLIFAFIALCCGIIFDSEPIEREDVKERVGELVGER